MNWLPFAGAALALSLSGALLAGPTAAPAWNPGGGERDEALRLTPDAERGLQVYQVCAACHLTEGWGTCDGTFPQLAGQHREVLIKQLADIRARNRDNPTMYPFALPEAIGDAQAVADVTEYIRRLKMNPDNCVGDGEPGDEEFVSGERLYREHCVRCHGERGEGDAARYYPRIGGQHYRYMLRQLRWIRDGKRRNANPEMVKQIQGLSEADMRAVINYASRLRPPAERLAPSAQWRNPDFH